MESNWNIDELIKEKLKNQAEQPPSSTWDRLEESLDRNTVWGRLEDSLIRRDRFIWFRNIAAVVTGILLLAFSASYLVLTNNDKIQLTEVTEKPVKPKNEKADLTGKTAQQKNEESVEVVSGPKDVVQNDEVQTAVKDDSNNFKTEVEEQDSSNDTSEKRLLQANNKAETNNFTVGDSKAEAGSEPINLTSMSLAAIQTDNEQLNHIAYLGWENLADTIALANKDVEASKISVPFGPRFYVGLYAGYKNQWMLNNETYNGLRGDNLNNTLLDFSSSTFLTLGYQVNASLSIELNYYHNSEMGQKYVDYKRGRRESRELDIIFATYSAQLNYRYGTFSMLNMETALYTFLGGYYAHLSEATSNNYTSIASKFTASDYGVLAGTGIDVEFARNWWVGARIQLHQGVANVYDGEGKSKDKFSTTYLLSSELDFGIKYFIK